MAQVFPTVREFTSDSVGTGDYYAEYISFRPNTTDYALSHMHDGFQGFNGGGGFQVTNAALHKNASGNPDRVCQMWTTPTPDGCEARATFRHLFLTGSVTPGTLAPLTTSLSCFVYLHGGSMVGSGKNQRRGDMSGYEVRLKPGASGTPQGDLFFQIQIIKWNAGVAASPLTSSGSLPLTFGTTILDPTQPITLAIRVVETSPGVQNDILATVSGWGVGTFYSASVPDASSPHNPATHFAGFGTQGHIELSSIVGTLEVVDLVESFEVRDGGGAVIFRDEFERFGLSGGFEPYSYTFSGDNYGGNYLSGAFRWDAFAFDTDDDGTGTDGSGPLLEHDRTNGRVFVNLAGTSNQSGYVLIASKPASDIRSQHRSVDVRIDPAVSGSGAHRFGIVLRASQATAATSPETGSHPGLTCYLAEVLCAAGAPTYRVRRFVSGSAVILAEYVDDYLARTAWPGFGAFQTLEFEVYNAESTSTDGPTVIEFKVDGVRVPLVLSGTAPSGVSVASGLVTDASQSKVSSGGGEGLYYGNNNTNTTTIDFDDWTQLALTNVNTVAPDDQATIVVPLESDISPVGILNTVLAPDFPFTRRRWSPVFGYQMDSGHRVTNARFKKLDGTIRRREYIDFSKESATKAEWDAFWTFHDDHKGTEIPFSFVDPDTLEVFKVHFEPGTVQGAKTAKGRYSLSFSLEELY